MIAGIRELLAEGRVDLVTARLGAPFELSGLVTQGDRRGRTIGFPTANIVPGPATPVPSAGVYAGAALDRPAAISVGVRPTFGRAGELRVEVHVLDFAGDLYGTRLTVAFLARLRDERRFAGPDALAQQLLRTSTPRDASSTSAGRRQTVGNRPELLASHAKRNRSAGCLSASEVLDIAIRPSSIR
ncbi:MAG: riboflavin kinase [Solirubrobacteraceae bacterium]